MGLDMFLTKKTYLGTKWEHRNVKLIMKVLHNEKELDLNINPKKVDDISEEIMYWRKANHIHKWFVDNVQEGVDDCRQYHVVLEELKDLANLCKEVIDNREKAKELLPTKSGFFFGDEQYDTWYWDDTIRTYTVISNLIENHKEIDGFGIDYYYQSSW